MYSITIDGEDLATFKRNIAAINQALNDASVIVGANTTVPAELNVAPKGKPGPKPKAKPVEKEEPKAVEPEVTAEQDAGDDLMADLAPEKPAVSKEEVTKAFQELCKKNVPAARDILAKFEADRFSNVKEEKLGDFYEAVKQALGK